METQYEEKNIYLTCKHDIDRSKKEEKNPVGQEQESKHFARIVISPIIEKTVDTTYCYISNKCTQKSYKQQYQRQQWIDCRSCLLTKSTRKHSSHK